MSALSALSASSLGSDLETSTEKKAKSVIKGVSARGRGKSMFLWLDLAVLRNLSTAM